MRSPICSFDISSEKTPTAYSRCDGGRGSPERSGMAIDSAMFIMNEVFPMLGLAAMMIRSCGWKPEVNSLKRS